MIGLTPRAKMTTMKKRFERKRVAIAAAAACLLVAVALLPSPAIASLLPAQQLPGAPGGSGEGETESPRRALGGGFKLEGETGLDSYFGFGKNKKREAVESRSLRGTSALSPPSPLRNQRSSYGSHAPPPLLI